MPLSTLETVALFRLFPSLQDRVPWALLGEWPTPVQPLDPANRGAGGDVWVKREDLSSPVYGGNKVRTLEAHFGRAIGEGKARVWSTGAFGSNHATATLLHGPRVGLKAGAMLFSQPSTATAHANLRAMAASGEQLEALLTIASLPFGIIGRRRAGDYVMTPGGATPTGSMGHISAGLELASQVEAGELPPPRHVFLAAGSTCTTSGLLVGLHIAASIGVGFGPGKAPIPIVRPVRVTPWPVTSKTAILVLARLTARRFTSLIGRDMDLGWGRLGANLDVVGGHLGKGYGYPTVGGRTAIAHFLERDGPKLDVVYSGKAAAGLLASMAAKADGPALFWATKSTAPLPKPTPEQLAALPRSMRRWLDKPAVKG